MKLKNKRTGEIGELQVTEKHCAVAVGNGTASCGTEIYSSLAQLFKEWEDAPEEPKEFWFVDADGEVRETNYLSGNDKVSLRNFGNYFDTQEEAEKAVEKLKAWKRLKDKGFRFVLSATTMDRIDIIRECFYSIEQAAEAKDDIIILFGGGECN